MALETIALEHVPPTHAVHLAYFQHVENAAFLHKQLLDRNTDFEYAFIDASVVLSRRQLLSAVFKAVTSAVNGGLKTPNVHSETVVSLNPSNNIADAYRRFGISPDTKDLLVVKVTFPTGSSPNPPTAADIWAHLQANVQGTPTAATDAILAQASDLAKVRKYYKLNGIGWLDAIHDEKQKRFEMDTLVVSSIALRGL